MVQILKGSIDYIKEASSERIPIVLLRKDYSKETFNKITRGYYLNGRLVFYKDNFIYDDALIVEAIKHLGEIIEVLQIDNFNIYFGVLPEDNFAPDFFFGKYEEGSLIKPLVKKVK